MITGSSQRLSHVSHKVLPCSVFLIKWSVCSLLIVLVYGNKHFSVFISVHRNLYVLPIGVLFHGTILIVNDKTNARTEEKINTCQGNGAKQSQSWLVLCRSVGRARFWHPCSLSTTKGSFLWYRKLWRGDASWLNYNLLSNHLRRSTKGTSKGHWAVLPRTGLKWCNSRQLYLAFWGKQWQDNCDISDSFIIGF